MDDSKKGALRRYHQDLRAGIRVGNILPALRTVLTDAEYDQVEEREDNVATVDELIKILLTKENRHFDAFCTALEKNGYEHWARKLQKQVNEIEGLEVNAPPLSQTQVQFPIIDDLADDFALLIAEVNREVHSLSASRLRGLKALFEEKLKSKGTPIAIPGSADELINFISQYWDCLSFEFAQPVVRYLGKEDLLAQLQRYEESLRRKAEILLTHCRQKDITPRAPPGCFSMKITVDEDPYSFSLHRILEIKDFLVHRIKMDMALFIGWHHGSIFLHFCILEEDMETAVRQLYAHKLELRAMQVVAIEVGDVIVYRDALIERPPTIAAVSSKIDDLAVAMETGGPIVSKVPEFGLALPTPKTKARLTMSAEDSKVVKDEVARMRDDIEKVRVQKRERLQTMDFFLLDNSIRESTVGQLRSHTIENKKAILEQVKKCGIKDIVVATFSHMTRVDDTFCQWLVDSGQDRSHFYSFSEVTEGLKDGAYDTETVPVSLRKNKKYGLANTVFEADLASKDTKWGVKFTVNDFCTLMLKWIKWMQKNISQDARILLNLRDFPVAMMEVPERVLEVVTFLARLPEEHRMFGLCFEDPFGEYLPEELEAWTASLRRTMDSNGWSSGKLLAHIHQKWDLQTASQLDCLSAGADGVWASLCEEGAALGHACSSVTMMNLVRMGNKKIQMKYNCKHLRTAAAEITKITTGKDPHPRQPIYGARACDLVFGFLGTGDFDVADFFGVEAPKRITTLATTDMLKERLTELFGVHEQFNDEIASKMKEKMLEDLHEGRKKEYMSKVGIAMLFDRAGGKLTPAIADVIANAELTAPHHQAIIDEIRKEWDEWDSQEEKKNDDCLQFDSFYHGFMQPYFGCYRCVDTRLAFKAIDMDADGLVDWNEFLVYIKWALHEYPEITTADETLSVAFEKGLIPAMRDEKLNNREHYRSSSFRF